MVEYRYKVYILTYLSYVGVHSLRTSYSFSKSTLGGIIQVNDAELGKYSPIQGWSTPS